MSAALVAGLAGCGARLQPVPTPTFRGTIYESQVFGYRVVLPPGWRRSSSPKLSGVHPEVAGTGRTGVDIFTVRTIDDEARLVACCLTEVATAVTAYTAIVHVDPNPRRLSAEQWIRESFTPERTTPTTVSGRPGLRVTGVVTDIQTRDAIGLWIGRDDVMFVVIPLQFYPRWLPPGWTAAQLARDAQQIVDSFEFTR